MLRQIAIAVAALVVLAVAIPVAAIALPRPFFAYHTEFGRLSLWSDQPFDAAAGRRVLADVEARLATSPLDDAHPHAIFIANAPWREALFFNLAHGAAGVNYFPISNDVFLRRADVGRDVLYGHSGMPAPSPRTLAYYGAHEIAHSFTAERLGARRLWNRSLPQWVREGYADYVGMGGRVDIDDLYRRYRASDPELDWRRSGTYARFRLLVAYMLERRHWSVDRLLTSGLGQPQAEAMMNAGMTGHS
ncbi:MAG TPA: hypothetical protein VFE13_08815 [Caulobacteraceae bacterium]|jgi:hypothetical protein|nr:hypothetical protein [Caulobacteraceae bacterium]